jgi:hypothetical protein
MITKLHIMTDDMLTVSLSLEVRKNSKSQKKEWVNRSIDSNVESLMTLFARHKGIEIRTPERSELDQRRVDAILSSFMFYILCGDHGMYKSLNVLKDLVDLHERMDASTIRPSEEC